MARIFMRLFVAGNSARSQRAIERVFAACQEFPPEYYQLEIIDVLDDPGMADQHRILATPALLRLAPLPVKQLIGDMSDGGSLQRLLEEPGSIQGPM